MSVLPVVLVRPAPFPGFILIGKPDRVGASYLSSFAWRFNRRYQLDSLTERLAYACARTAPHPYRVIITG